jgi:pimeloyl-ACP methyl ester carboxylesterase
MLVELVQTTTSDGVTLHGALYPATPVQHDRTDVDVVVCLHGVGGNFYSSALFNALAGRLQQQGLAVLCVNTRGHDSVSFVSTASAPQRLGAAYETVGKCVHDVAAWCELARNRGLERIALLGHSLGAIKSVYAATHVSDLNLGRIVAMSPPRLSYEAFMSGPRRTRFQQTIQLAEDNVARGEPDALFLARVPFPLLITAAGYLEKYGPQENYNLLRFAHRLPCPTLFTYGQLELNGPDVSFAGMPDLIRNLPHQTVIPQCTTIAGADHMYNGTFEQVWTTILDWLIA